MVEEIKHGASLLSIIIRSDFSSSGIKFFTPDNYSQQLAYMKRNSGYEIEPHIHNQLVREVMYTKEVLIIKSGKVRVDFYDDERSYLLSKILNAGDVILLAFGGHGFSILEDAEIIEVKQGPYLGENDKVRFAAIDADKLVVK